MTTEMQTLLEPLTQRHAALNGEVENLHKRIAEIEGERRQITKVLRAAGLLTTTNGRKRGGKRVPSEDRLVLAERYLATTAESFSAGDMGKALGWPNPMAGQVIATLRDTGKIRLVGRKEGVNHVVRLYKVTDNG